MPQSRPEQLFPLLFGIWIAYGSLGFALFALNRDAALKRSLWPPFAVASALLFAVITWLMGVPTRYLSILIPVLILMVWANLRTVRFCDSCGRTIMNQTPFSKPEFCSKCGAKLGS